MKVIKHILYLIGYAIYIPTGVIISILGIAVGVYKHPARLLIADDELYQRRDTQPAYQNMEV